MSSKIFVISGPSGSGKSTLLAKLTKEPGLRKNIAKSVSFTTRPKRTGEREARDYFFIALADFKRALRQKKILEWTNYLGYYYGTPKDFVQKALQENKYVLLCLDFKGALRIKRLYPVNAVTIFVSPPSVKELRARITQRCNRTGKDEIRRRLSLAHEELLAAKKYDYCVLNKDLDTAVRKLRGIILKEIKH